ncbi:hypothetical protein WICMUC_005084 [Wickerhamomyces mucosus]|uniref:Uncharacterized protein n=1 Tax=Wickerhamomyces mucosus TaxID=1378264 RepID=A0A9P8PCF3_9ASCO|nr:hypothetical protein WICMUC_005084 [Wickerhamomyces mucosus]
MSVDNKPMKAPKNPTKLPDIILAKKCLSTSVKCTFSGDKECSKFRSCIPRFYYLHETTWDRNLVFPYKLDHFEKFEFRRREAKNLNIFVFNAKVTHSGSFLPTSYQMFLVKDPKMSAAVLADRLTSLACKLVEFSGDIDLLPDELNENLLLPSNREFESMERMGVSQTFMKLFTLDFEKLSNKRKLNRDELLEIVIQLNGFIRSMLSEHDGDEKVNCRVFQNFDFYKVGNPINPGTTKDYPYFRDSFFLVPENSRKYFKEDLIHYFIAQKRTKDFTYPLEYKIDISKFDAHRYFVVQLQESGGTVKYPHGYDSLKTIE